MSSLGQTLRQAREAKGLSQSQVASQTRILVQIINDIENEDFHRIAAPIYGRGFVRLFAECVDLDPQPLIREFMDIYEGRRAPTVMIREIPTEEPSPMPESSESASLPPPIQESFSVPTPPSVPLFEGKIPEPAPEPEPATIPESESPLSQSFVEDGIPGSGPIPEPEQISSEPPPIVRGLDLFDQAMEPLPSFPSTSEASETVSPEPSSRTDFTASPFLPPTYEDHGPSAAERFKNGISSVSHGVLRSVQRIPRSTWRKSVLACGAAAIVAVMVFGCIQLYKMTTPSTPACEGNVCEFNPRLRGKPDAAPSASPKTKQQSVPVKTDPAKTTTAKKAVVQQPPKSTRIRSTGQKVPPLYVD